jgi:hypothetical protein
MARPRGWVRDPKPRRAGLQVQNRVMGCRQSNEPCGTYSRASVLAEPNRSRGRRRTRTNRWNTLTRESSLGLARPSHLIPWCGVPGQQQLWSRYGQGLDLTLSPVRANGVPSLSGSPTPTEEADPGFRWASEDRVQPPGVHSKRRAPAIDASAHLPFRLPSSQWRPLSLKSRTH